MSNNNIWNKISICAVKLNISLDTISQWKHRKYVPPSRHHEIVAESKKLRFGITHKMLHEMWTAVKKN